MLELFLHYLYLKILMSVKFSLMAYVSTRAPTQLGHIIVNARMVSRLLEHFFVKVNSVCIQLWKTFFNQS